MLGQPAAHHLSPFESESVSPALVAVPIFSHLPEPESSLEWTARNPEIRTPPQPRPELSALAFRSATAVQTAVRLAPEKLHFQEVSPDKLPHEPRDNSPQPTNAPTGPPSVRGRVFAATDPCPASPGYLDPPRAQRRSTTDTPAHLPPIPPAPDASPHRPVPSSDGPAPARRRKTALAQDVRCTSIADGTAAPTASDSVAGHAQRRPGALAGPPNERDSSSGASQAAGFAAGAVLGQRLQILPPVFADHEDVLSIIAPSGNVMRNAHRDHTGRPRHKCSPIMTHYNLNSGSNSGSAPDCPDCQGHVLRHANPRLWNQA